jgi:ubiquinone/menaquinone biosynthesis C-methylase UbiE
MVSAVIQSVGKLHQRFVKPRQAERIVDYLLKFLPPEGHVLDVGCGTGRIARLLAERNPKLRIEGIDVLAQPRAEIPVTVFDGVTIPWERKTVDAVMLVDVLHHTDRQAQLLREALRVSRGPVVIKDHVSETRLDRAVLAFMDWVGNRSLGIASLHKYCSKAQWEQLFEEVGVRACEMTPVTGLYPFPFNLVFERNKQVMFRIEA